jgi:hypothetical protein
MNKVEAMEARVLGTDVTFTEEDGSEVSGVITHLHPAVYGKPYIKSDWVAEVVSRGGVTHYIDLEELSS